MGFLIALVMRTFSLDLSSILKMPKKHLFWMMNQVERVRAYEDLRQIRLLVNTQDPEGMIASAKGLENQMGVIYHEEKAPPPKFEFKDEDGLDPEFNQSALRALKHRHGA